MQLNEQHNAHHDFWQQCLGLRIEVILQQQVHFRPVNIGFNADLERRAKLVKRNLRIALINSIVMQFISNFDISFYY